MTDTSSTQPLLRVALFGAGRHAQHHARSILRCPGVELAAVADPSASARAAIRVIAPAVREYDTPTALLKDGGVDVVHICTPPISHSELALKSLTAGCHIYVEKPFTESVDEARRILHLAKSNGLLVCAGHQLLFESPTTTLTHYLPAIGRIAHVESYFSFRTVRHAPGGRRVLRADEQLLDILPHPVYLLLKVLEDSGAGEVELAALELSRSGTVHALVRRGEVTASLVVTLEGRPIESFLRVVGRNGALVADYVRGTVRRSIGPGSTGIDKLLAPYREAWQLLGGSTIAFGRRFLKRQRSYPGMVELFSAFYASIRSGTTSPMSPESLVETVRICERVANALKDSETAALAASVPRPMEGRGVLVTGGSGFLGRALVEALLAQGQPVRVLARREPPAWERAVGAEYVAADIASTTDAHWYEGIETVVHAAAETAGGWEEHQRNSIDATERMIRGAAEHGIHRFVHVSSLAVLSKDAGGPIRDEHPLASDSRRAGPYVWGKLESERLAVQLGDELRVEVKVVRPGALVDFTQFEPPGRLGKRLGNLFVAVGSPSQCLGVVDVRQAAQVIAWMTRAWDEAPTPLNLIDPALPSKRDLLKRLRADNPDLSVLWLPTALLLPLSWFATLLQKTLRPKHPAIDVAKVFATQNYDQGRIAVLLPLIERGATTSSQPNSGVPAFQTSGSSTHEH